MHDDSTPASNPERSTVLLIQGVGASGLAWKPQIETLSHRYQAIAFDNPGIGLAPDPVEPVTVGSLADHALRVLEAAGAHSAHLVGHSLGGLVALELALREPKRWRSLTMLCSFADGRGPLRFSWRMAWIGTRTRLGTKRMRRHAFLELILPPDRLANADVDGLAAEYAELFGHDLAVQPPVASQQLRAMGRCDLSRRLNELAGLPTLIVSATLDPIAPPALGRQCASGIPGATYVEFPHASHGLPLSHPQEANRLLLEHLDKVDRDQGRHAGA
jgi:pimeloyl-ACP methyl ester carboxylesterase